jgi:uncharacterized protein
LPRQAIFQLARKKLPASKVAPKGQMAKGVAAEGLAVEGLFVALKIIPNRQSLGVEGIENSADGQSWLKIAINAPARDGQANQALLKYLAKLWDISPCQLKIVRGDKARHKRLLVTCAAPEKLFARLTLWCASQEWSGPFENCLP